MPSSAPVPTPDATVIAVGVDPLFTQLPPAQLPGRTSTSTGAPRYTLEALINAVSAEPLDQAAIAARGERPLGADARQGARRREGPAPLPGAGRAPLEQGVGLRLRRAGARRRHDLRQRARPRHDAVASSRSRSSFYGVSTAGVLGWGVGAALGAKLAVPDRTVIACIGDGSYMFGVPEAGHWVSRKMNLPVLYLVWNNSRWNAVASATRSVYPDGWAVRTSHKFPSATFGPPSTSRCSARPAGGYGERVEDPAEVPAAIERALHAVRSRSARRC